MQTVTELFDFQKKTVNWILNAEESYSGGLLMNDMGLGKSLCMIDVLSRTFDNGGVNLIVCPSNLVLNWKKEIDRHSSLSSDKILVIDKIKNLDDDVMISKHRVVITSYNCIARGNPHVNVRYKRVILDEAHYVRNPATKAFKSLSCIPREITWIMTATPIFNTHHDMFSYYKLLGVEGCDTYRDWCGQISNGIEGMRKLNEWNKKYGIQMKKQDVNLILSKSIVIDVGVDFTSDERAFYDVFTKDTLEKIEILKIMLKNPSLDNNSRSVKRMISMHILGLIMKLKQCCNDPSLVARSLTNVDTNGTVAEITKRLEYYINSRVTDEECAICYSNTANRIINPCGHKFCSTCCGQFARSNITTCPLCRGAFNSIDAIGESGIQMHESTHVLMNEDYMSSKFAKAIDIIKHIMSKNEKVVIVSQWVKTIDTLKNIISKSDGLKDINSITLSGKVPLKKRNTSINEFQSNSDIKICYLSLLSGAEGVTLTSANHVVCLDNWWNDSKMQQCFARIHRIGQEKQVFIHRLMVSNTIELQINKILMKKSKRADISLSRVYTPNDSDENIINEKISLISL